jgi:hypothetical protein
MSKFLGPANQPEGYVNYKDFIMYLAKSIELNNQTKSSEYNANQIDQVRQNNQQK